MSGDRRVRAVVLLVVQAALVLSIAAKYLYERRTSPRVWVRTQQYDPNLALRGRYLSLQLVVDACGLPQADALRMGPPVTVGRPDVGSWQWTVRPVVKDGKLVPVLAASVDKPTTTDLVTVWASHPCDRAALAKSVEYFVPDTAANPLPRKPGQELWVEVTVPPMGPPRPIQLAVSGDGAFTPLELK